MGTGRSVLCLSGQGSRTGPQPPAHSLFIGTSQLAVFLSGETAWLKHPLEMQAPRAPAKEHSQGGSAPRLLGEPEVGAVSSTEDVAQDKV